MQIGAHIWAIRCSGSPSWRASLRSTNQARQVSGHCSLTSRGVAPPAHFLIQSSTRSSSSGAIGRSIFRICWGLDWEIPSEFQRVRDREKQLEQLKKAAQGNLFGQVIGTVAELRPQLTIAESNARKLREQLANFEVLESYRDLSQRAARAKTEMQALGREAVSLQESLQYLESALSSEMPPERADLQQMYEAAGIELPEVALRRFEDVNRFYSSVIENRRTHLEKQISEVRQLIAQGDRRMASLDVERRDILRTLEGRGALEDFLRLQSELATLEASAASLRERFKAAEALESDSTQLEIDRTNLKQRTPRRLPGAEGHPRPGHPDYCGNDQ